MNHPVRSLAAAAVLAAIVTIHPTGAANAEPCLSGGGRIYQYCASVPNAIGGFVPSPGLYAPLPGDPTPPTNIRQVHQLQRALGPHRRV